MGQATGRESQTARARGREGLLERAFWLDAEND